MNTRITSSQVTRRRFVGRALGAVAMTSMLAPAVIRAAEEAPKRKIRLGVVGLGGRGAWIARLFRDHGGYEMHAVADYFPPVAEGVGKELGVDKARCFAGLRGCQRVIASGVEAIVLETPPYFFPEHAKAAVDAGLHVYMAKPVAVDVPGCLAIQAAAAKAKAGKKVFLVDYQLPTEPSNIQVMKAVKDGEIGPINALHSHYFAGPFPDPAFTANYESRLRGLIWCNDVAMGGGYHVNACIHGLDAALWAAGQRPVSCMGVSRLGRPDPHGDSHDVFELLFEYENGILHSHRGEHLNNYLGFDVICQIVGQTGFAQTCYGGRTMLKARENVINVEVPNPYNTGAARNIAKFHKAVTDGDFTNDTVPRSVDGALATILGREAGKRRAKLTMEQLLKENQKLEVNLKGLKA